MNTNSVTNSRFTSFVIIGVKLSVDFVKEKLSHISEKDDYYIEDYLHRHYDDICSMIEGSDLSFSFGPDGNEFMIGINYTKMIDDETLSEFKARVQKQLLDYLGVTEQVVHIQECWSNL